MSIKGAQETRRARGRPGVADLPQAEAGPAFYELSPLLVALERSTARAGAVRELATKIVLRHLGAGHRGLAVCGASAGVGVTFVAANLATAISQIGPSVLLVDANLNDPGVASYFRPPAGVEGVAETLENVGEPLSAHIHRDVLPGLSILYAGAPRPNGSDLLQQARFAQLIESSMRSFDCTLVDCPPANRSTGARRAATLTGHALIVTRRGFSYAADVATLTDELKSDGVEVLGSILNR